MPIKGPQLQLQTPSALYFSGFEAAEQSASIEYILPLSLPSLNQSLTATAINGSRVTLSWTTISSGTESVVYGGSGSQSTLLDRAKYLFDVSYNAAASDANAVGANIASTGGATNRNATALTLSATATGAGLATGLSVSASGASGSRAINATGSVNISSGSSYDLGGSKWLHAGAAGTANTFVGNSTNSSVSGSNNTVVGATAGAAITSGSSNAIVGAQAGDALTTGANNAYLGGQSGVTATAGNANVSGSGNTFVGYRSGPGTSTQLANATAIGSLATVSQDNSVVLGSINGVNGAAATASVGIGVQSPLDRLHIADGNLRISNSNNTAGELRLFAPSGTGSFYSAFKAGTQGLTINYTLPATFPATNQVLAASSVSSPNATMSWIDAMLYNTASQQASATARTNWLFNVAYNASANDANAVGALITATAGATNRTATGLTVAATGTGNGLATGLNLTATASTGAATGLSVTATGGTGSRAIDAAGRINVSTGSSYDINGSRWMYAGVGGSSNTLIGNTGNTAISGGSNTAVGTSAGAVISSGASNSVVGASAGALLTSGSTNAFFGASSGAATSTTSNNSFFGASAGASNTTGASNTFLGMQAGVTGTGGNATTTGSSNTFVGYRAGAGTSTQLTNATVIGALATVTQDNSLILGSINGNNGASSDTKVGIGTTAPSDKLDIMNGNLRLSNSNSTPAELRFYERSDSGSEYTSFKARAQRTTLNYTLPDTAGASGNVLTNDGSGNLYWSSNVTIGSLRLGGTTTITFTGHTNNYPLDANKSVFRMSSNSNINLTGLIGGIDGRIVVLINVGSNSITLSNENSGSDEVNRFKTGTGSGVGLLEDNVAMLVYDGQTLRWRVVSVQK